MAEVNRIAALLGLDGVHAAMSKVKRVKREGNRVRRVCEGNIPLAAADDAVRLLRGQQDYYRDRSPLPFEAAG
jgi:hypothetical protein